MLLDFDELHPETPRLPAAVSLREGILLSLVVHAAFLLLLALGPPQWLAGADAVDVVDMAEWEPPEEPPLRFVEAVPLRELPAPPRFPAPASDLDRRSATPERPPEPTNIEPFSRGNTPEYLAGATVPPRVAEGTPSPAPAEPAVADATPPPVPELEGPAIEPPVVESRPEPAPRTGNFGNALQNLEQYLRPENFDNPQGGDIEQSADIQFDTMGVDFGPWLLQFKRQVERNWIVPAAAMTYRGSTVIQFYVLRNGRLADITVLRPAERPALTNSALNALKLSNPTARLPPEYPVDRALITVTFHYNEFY